MLLRLLLLFTVAIAISAAAEPVNQLSEAEKLDGWQLLFDGKTTTGWEGFNDTALPSRSWALEDGTIRTLADSSGGDLVTVSQFENFELVFDWKIVEHGNSGLKYGVQKAWAGPGYSPHLSRERKARALLGATGFEYQVLDDTTLNHNRKGWEYSSCGSLYLLYTPDPNKKVNPPGEWNSSRIVVNGTHGEHWLNGMKVVEFEFNSPEMLTRVKQTKFGQVPGFGMKGEGFIALTHHNHPAWYRNIKVRALDGPRTRDYLPGRLFDPEGLIPPPPRPYPQPGDPTARR